MAGVRDQLILDGSAMSNSIATSNGMLSSGVRCAVTHAHSNGAVASSAGVPSIAPDSAGHASGTCLGDASLFGRRAARHLPTERK